MIMRARRAFSLIVLASLAGTALAVACGDDDPTAGTTEGADGSADGSSGGDTSSSSDGSNGGGDGSIGSDASSDAVVDADAGRQWVYFAGGQAGTAFGGFAWNPTTRTLTPIDSDPDAAGQQYFTAGGLPAAIAAHPSGQWVYTANSVTGNKGISAFAHDAVTGRLTRIAANALDGGMDLLLGADTLFVSSDPKGRVLYALRANGFLDTLSVNATTGQLTVARSTTTASLPQWIAVDSAARFLLVGGNGGELMIHRLDATTGLPLAVDGGVDTGTAYAVPGSAFEVTLRAGGSAAYVAAPNANDVLGFSIDPATLVMTPLAATTGDAGYPFGIATDPAGKFLYTAQYSIDVRAIAVDGTLGAITGSVAPNGQCLALSFSPDGRTLFAHCYGSVIVPIDPMTGAMSAPAAGPFGAGRNSAWVIR
jgi:6-phosphogluconolactonase (cycloisomerase 2 family)